MGFLKKFFRNVFRDGSPPQTTAASSTSAKKSSKPIWAWSATATFCCPARCGPSTICKSSRRRAIGTTSTATRRSKTSVPVLMAAASSENLFEVFMDLLDPLGSEVDVVLETSHNRQARGHADLYREHIDMPVLKSILYEYEDLLVNDGCTGIAVLNPGIPQEVQFDEHKLLIVYGNELAAYERVFADRDVRCNDKMKFITEAEHVHSSSEHYFEQFEELKMRLGMDVDYEQYAR